MAGSAAHLPRPDRDPYPVVLMPLGEVTVDARMQRDLNETRVKHIVTTYDAALAQIGNAATIDGVLTLIGGQHTHAAQLEKFGPEYLVYIKLLGELTPEQAAKYGLAMNTNPSRPNSVSRWESRIKAKDPDVLAVCAELTKRSVSVGANLGPYTISNPSPLDGWIKSLNVAGMSPGEPGKATGAAVGAAIDALSGAYPDGTDDAKVRLHHSMLRATVEFQLRNPKIAPAMIAKHALQGMQAADFIQIATPAKGQADWRKITLHMAQRYNSRSHSKIKANLNGLT